MPIDPEQWNAIGVLVGIIVAVLTYLTNLYFKIREDRRLKAIRALTSLFLLPLLTACGNADSLRPGSSGADSTDLTADTPIPGMVAPFHGRQVWVKRSALHGAWAVQSG
jgi:hypothetical protein